MNIHWFILYNLLYIINIANNFSKMNPERGRKDHDIVGNGNRALKFLKKLKSLFL